MSITVDEMKGQIDKIMELRRKETEAGAVKKVITEQLETEEARMLEMLQSEGLQSFRGAMLASMSFRTSVKTPKTPEDKEKFYSYLKEDGTYDDMVSVNSNTLNSYYKSKLEEAKAQGKTDFEIPGITEVLVLPRLSLCK